MIKIPQDLLQIFNSDNVEDLKKIWPLLTRPQRRKGVFTEAVCRDGCPNILAYCAAYADNRIKFEALMGCVKRKRGDLCDLIAPHCRPIDVRKALGHSLALHHQEVAHILSEYNTESLNAEEIQDVIRSFSTLSYQKVEEYFEILLRHTPQETMNNVLENYVLFPFFFKSDRDRANGFKEKSDVFYSKNALQQALEPIPKQDLGPGVKKRKM